MFGETGFHGRRTVRHLRGTSSRCASHRGTRIAPAICERKREARIDRVRRSRRALCRAGLQGCLRAVNAVSLYVEHGAETFRSVHVHSAQRVADEARRAGVKRTSRGAATRTQLGVERRRCVGGDRCYVAAPLDDRRLTHSAMDDGCEKCPKLAGNHHPTVFNESRKPLVIAA